MNRKIGLALVLFIVLISVSDVLSEISVGVKKGDWIEYTVAYTGTPTEGHDVTWARMEIKDVQGKSMSVEITVKYSNGTLEDMTTTLNLETGQLGDDFIIPANLNSGDTFFDKNVGNITISSIEERIYAGATRTVVHAATSENTYYWDKATGVLVEGNSQFPEYMMNVTVDKTNIWQPQLLGLDPTFFYALVIGAAVLIVVVLAFLLARRKK
jgi:hypothetical protein